MATATERFLRYVSFDTQSADGANAIPSNSTWRTLSCRKCAKWA